MATVKELKAILKEQKKKSASCAPYSNLKKAELIERVKELGITVPEKKPKIVKPKAKPKTKKNSNKKIPEDLIIFEKKFNKHLEELDRIFKSLKRKMSAEKRNEIIREFNKEYLDGYVKTREEFKVILRKLENPPKNKKVKLQRDKILNIINKIKKRYEAMKKKVRDHSGQVKKRKNLTLNEIFARELGFT